MTYEMTVRFKVPKGATANEVRQHFMEAMRCWGGQFRPPGADTPEDPGDWRFGLEPASVSRVRKVYR